MHQGDSLSEKTLLDQTFCCPVNKFLLFVRQIILSDEKFCPLWKAVLIYQLCYLEYLIKHKLRG